LAAFLLAAGCGESAATDKTKTAGSGQETFNRICAACHGPAGKGMPNLGKDMTTSEFIATSTDQEFMDFIKEGRAADHPENTTGVPMPPNGGDPTLTDKQISQVIEFVRTLQVKPKADD
jgi:mono/diheme cytochrome c family protein